MEELMRLHPASHFGRRARPFDFEAVETHDVAAVVVILVVAIGVLTLITGSDMADTAQHALAAVSAAGEAR